MYVPAAQLWHVLSEAPPSIPEYLPSGQPIHVEGPVAPSAVEYLPYAHALHSLVYRMDL